MSRADIIIRRNSVDGDEIKYFRVISDAPGRIYLNDGTTMVMNGGFVTASAATAGLRFKPNPNANGSYSIQAQAALTPTADGVGGEYATARILINPVADAPQITDTTVNEGEQSSSGLVITPNSADGAEVSHFRIANIVGGRLFLNDGVSGVLIGQYITAAQAAAGLRFSAPAISLSDGYIEVQAATGTSPTLTSATKTKGNVRVNDLTPPQLILPYDMILQSYTDSGTQLQYTATANDIRDGDVAIACDKVSGIVLPVGSHTVQCQARDARGNTATGSFQVIVQKIAPAVQLASIGAVSGNDVVLNWNLNPVMNEPYLYEVQRRAMPTGEWLTVKNNFGERTATIRSIGEVNYAFRVRAYLAGGAAGEWSNTVSTTIDETPPPISAWMNRGTGTGQSAEGTSNPRVRLTLQSGTNDPAVMWRWSQDGVTFSSWQSYQSKNEITLSGNDGYKEIRIEARDKVGNVGVAHTGIILNRDTYNGYRISRCTRLSQKCN
jgi:hypothetical protein